MLEVWRIPLDPAAPNPSVEAWVHVPPILAQTLDRNAGDLVFSRTERGRPFLPDAETFDFNLAHTKSLALLAVCDTGCVGIDLEEDRNIRHPMEIGHAVFGGELTWKLGQLQGLAQRKMFLRLWVRAEALLKATGEGLPRKGAALDTPGLWPGFADHVTRRGKTWSLSDRQLAPDMWAAIAIEGEWANHLPLCKLREGGPGLKS